MISDLQISNFKNANLFKHSPARNEPHAVISLDPLLSNLTSEFMLTSGT